MMRLPASRRAAAAIYRIEDNRLRYLWVSSRGVAERLVLPGGRIEPGETPRQCAIREAAEEAGVRCVIEQKIGRYLHEKHNGKVYLTDVFLARLEDEAEPDEQRTLRWLTADEMLHGDYSFPRSARSIVLRAHESFSRLQVA